MRVKKLIFILWVIMGCAVVALFIMVINELPPLTINFKFPSAQPEGTHVEEHLSNFEQAKQYAEKTNKPLLIIFHASWCQPCRRFEDTTLRDSRVIERLKSYVVYQCDVDKDIEIANEYIKWHMAGGEGVPSFVIVGKVKPYKLASGYKTSSEFLDFLK
jgi:thioredoxin:protein disulfide reductase